MAPTRCGACSISKIAFGRGGSPPRPNGSWALSLPSPTLAATACRGGLFCASPSASNTQLGMSGGPSAAAGVGSGCSNSRSAFLFSSTDASEGAAAAPAIRLVRAARSEWKLADAASARARGENPSSPTVGAALLFPLAELPPTGCRSLAAEPTRRRACTRAHIVPGNPPKTPVWPGQQ